MFFFFIFGSVLCLSHLIFNVGNPGVICDAIADYMLGILYCQPARLSLCCMMIQCLSVGVVTVLAVAYGIALFAASIDPFLVFV